MSALSSGTSSKKSLSASDVATAKESIYIVTSTRNPKARFLIVDFGQFARDRFKVQNNTPFQEREGASTLLYFRADVGINEDEDAMLSFCNAVGDIWEQLELAAGNYKDRTIFIKSIELKTPPTRIAYEDRDAAGDYIECVLEIQYTRQP